MAGLGATVTAESWHGAVVEQIWPSAVGERSVPWRWTRFAHCLQEIKKKKGIKEEVQLTSKQKEMLQAQLDKEAQIRRRLQEVSGCCPHSPMLWVLGARPSPPSWSRPH